MNKRTVLAFPADMQCGSTKGIMPVGGWKAKDGQIIHASLAQEILKAQWDEGWDRVKELRKGGKLAIISMGEAIDGNHHGTTQLVVSDIEEQKRMHTALMREAMKKAKFKNNEDRLYYLDSTEVHTGGSEDAIARDFVDPRTGQYLATPREKESYPDANDGRFSWDVLKLDVNGVYIILSHQIFTGGRRAWTKNNTIRAVLTSYYYECIEYGMRIPRYIICSHIHRHLKGRIDEHKATMEGITTPSFQYKTRNAHRQFALDFNSVGMLIVVVEPDGSTWWECPHISVDNGKEVEKI